MSLTKHSPAERAAFRQALDTLAIALRQYHPASEVIGAFLESYPALPPLPVIERWVTIGEHKDGQVTYPDNPVMRVKHGSRIYRLEAVEEVTPTPTPVRVTLDGEVWERDESGWETDGVRIGRHSYASAALDRIHELEAGR